MGDMPKPKNQKKGIAKISLWHLNTSECESMFDLWGPCLLDYMKLTAVSLTVFHAKHLFLELVVKVPLFLNLSFVNCVNKRTMDCRGFLTTYAPYFPELSVHCLHKNML
jgi:hypothetical protein